MISPHRSGSLGTVIGTILSVSSFGALSLPLSGCNRDASKQASTPNIISETFTERTHCAFENCGWSKDQLESLRHATFILQSILPQSDPRLDLLQKYRIVPMDPGDPLKVQAFAYFDRPQNDIKLDPALLKDPFLLARNLAHELFHVEHHSPFTMQLHLDFKREVEAFENDLKTLSALISYAETNKHSACTDLQNDKKLVERNLAAYRVKYSLAVLSELHLPGLETILRSQNLSENADRLRIFRDVGRNLAGTNTIYINNIGNFLAETEAFLIKPEMRSLSVEDSLEIIKTCREDIEVLR